MDAMQLNHLVIQNQKYLYYLTDFTYMGSNNKYYDERMLPHYIEKAEEDFDTCIEYCDNNKRKGNR